MLKVTTILSCLAIRCILAHIYTYVKTYLCRDCVQNRLNRLSPLSFFRGCNSSVVLNAVIVSLCYILVHFSESFHISSHKHLIKFLDNFF